MCLAWCELSVVDLESAPRPIMENAVNSVWVFRRLWRASFPLSLDAGACPPSKFPSPFVPIIRLKVATVVIFTDGSPRCWLDTTEDGRLRGQELSPTPSGTRHDSWREPEERMRWAVDTMREFWEHHNQRESSSAGEPSCVVRSAMVRSIAFFLTLTTMIIRVSYPHHQHKRFVS